MKAQIYLIPNRCAQLLFLVVALLLALVAVVSAQTSAQAKRALIISLDGMDTRYLVDADKYGLKIPTLRALMADGVTSRGVYSVYPSLTYPNHTSMVTGVTPSVHGIFGNEVFEEPGSVPTGAGVWFAKDIKAETLWQAAKGAGKTTGLVSWPVGAGAGDWNVPEIWALRGTAEKTRDVVAQNSRPAGLLDEIEKKYPDFYKNSTPDEGDDARTLSAEYILAQKKPDVMLVHLIDLDHFEHKYGPFTPEAFAMLEKLDGYVARMLAAMDRAGTRDETAVFIVSDHGFKPITRLINPGVLLTKAGLVETKTDKDESGKEKQTITGWKAAVYITGAACAIYLKDPNDKGSLKKLHEIFDPLAGKPDTGILKVFDAGDLKKLGSNTRAALMLEGADGYTFGGNYLGEFSVESKTKGMHGYLPTTPNFFASFIASGAGVTARGWIDNIQMTSVGPTAAAVIGIKLKDAQGKPVSLGKATR